MHAGRLFRVKTLAHLVLCNELDTMQSLCHVVQGLLMWLAVVRRV